jgi:hypothetical protein
MKLWIATAALAVTGTGCAGGHAGTRASETGSRSAPIAPSDEEVKQSYEDLLYRSMCRGVAHCVRPRVDAVSQVECASVARPDRIRCDFLVHEEIPLPDRGHTGLGMNIELHLCTGLFQRRRNDWRMLSVLGECPPRVASGAD